MTNPHSRVNKVIRYLIVDIDENWFSFFSGMLSNIPISLLFMYQNWGDNVIEHWFFIFHLITFVISLPLVAVGFILTIKKIEINKSASREYENWVKENRTTSNKMQEEILNNHLFANLSFFRYNFTILIILFSLAFTSIFVLWILYFIM